MPMLRVHLYIIYIYVYIYLTHVYMFTSILVMPGCESPTQWAPYYEAHMGVSKNQVFSLTPQMVGLLLQGHAQKGSSVDGNSNADLKNISPKNPLKEA